MHLLSEFHRMNALKAETFFLTVDLVDRCLSRSKVKKACEELPLLAVTCMHIASKYEEIHPPSLEEERLGTLLADWGITKQEVLDLEVNALTLLNFDLSLPSPLAFLDLLIFEQERSPEYVSLCRYMLELTLFDHYSRKYLPSHLAAATLFLTNAIIEVGVKDVDDNVEQEIAGLFLEIVRDVSPEWSQLLREFNITKAEFMVVAGDVRDGIFRLIHLDMFSYRYYDKVEELVRDAVHSAYRSLEDRRYGSLDAYRSWKALELDVAQVTPTSSKQLKEQVGYRGGRFETAKQMTMFFLTPG